MRKRQYAAQKTVVTHYPWYGTPGMKEQEMGTRGEGGKKKERGEDREGAR